MIPVYWETYQVGSIDVTSDGPEFIYKPQWTSTRNAFPVSLRMPMAGIRHEAAVTGPWLANLLPEADALTVVGRRLGVAPEDVVGLLTKIGHDTAGGLSIGHIRTGETAGYRQVETDAELERILNELPAKPFLVGEEGVSMSLAGVQDKLPVAIVNGRICVPVGGAPSTHILKPDNTQQLFGSVENEALCQTLAYRCGLGAARVTTGLAGDRSYLLATRFDRQPHREGAVWYRLHQEDFCQALGKPPSAKYEHNQTGIKGPRIADMFAVVSEHMTAVDRMKLLDAVIFNVLVDNTDAHAKNYSILLSGRGPRMAPLYDVMCASCWNVTRNMAQTIGGKDRGDHVYGRHWQRLADDCGLNRSLILDRVEKLSGRVLNEVAAATAEVAAMPAGDCSGMLGQFSEAIARRCRTVSTNISKVEMIGGKRLSEGNPSTGQAPAPADYNARQKTQDVIDGGRCPQGRGKRSRRP